MGYTTNNVGINLIKEFEGCVLTAYKCPAGQWTIGYGHTSGVKEGQTITQAQAEAYLRTDLAIYENAVNSYVKVSINQNQFDALVSFAYNCGVGALQTSTLLQLLNIGDYTGAANQLDLWNKGGGVVLVGLVRRRAAEKALFLAAGTSYNQNSASGNEGVRVFQSWMNCEYSTGLVMDGIYGPKTETAAIKVYQTILGVPADGIFGTQSKAAVKTMRDGSQGHDVAVLQGMLYCLGYDPRMIDGIYGDNTAAAVRAYQKDKNLTQDGLAGRDTMSSMFA